MTDHTLVDRLNFAQKVERSLDLLRGAGRFVARRGGVCVTHPAWLKEIADRAEVSTARSPDDATEAREAIRRLSEQWDTYDDLLAFQAKALKTFYDKLIGIGFTEREALFIVANDRLGR